MRNNILLLIGTVILIANVWLFASYKAVQYNVRHEIRDTCISEMHGGRDYQIELYMDTVWIYDGQRLVGTYISNWKNQIDPILIKDNE